jgi:hypothetical protein
MSSQYISPRGEPMSQLGKTALGRLDQEHGGRSPTQA